MADSIVGMGQLIDQLAALVGYLRSPPPRPSIATLGSRHKSQSNYKLIAGAQKVQLVQPDPKRFYLFIQVDSATDATLFIPSAQLDPNNTSGCVIPANSRAWKEWEWHKQGGAVMQDWWVETLGLATVNWIAVSEV